MTPDELEAHCQRQEGYGLSRVTLTMPEPKSGVTGYRVRTPFGLAEIATVNMGRVVFWVEIKKVRAWIAKARAGQ